MSAELIAQLASSGMTMREAAASEGLTYWQMRKLRDQHKAIPWQSSARPLTGAIAAQIRADDRPAAEVAQAYGISLPHVGSRSPRVHLSCAPSAWVRASPCSCQLRSWAGPSAHVRSLP